MNDYPMLHFLMRWGKLPAAGLAVAVFAAGLWGSGQRAMALGCCRCRRGRSGLWPGLELCRAGPGDRRHAAAKAVMVFLVQGRAS